LCSELSNAEELRSIMCQKLSKLYVTLNRLKEAEDYNQRAQTVLKKLRRQMGVAYCELNKALIAERRRDYRAALYAKTAEQLFDQSKAGQEISGHFQRIRLAAGKLKTAGNQAS